MFDMFNFQFIEGYINHLKKMLPVKIWLNLHYSKYDTGLIKILYMNVNFGKHKGSLPEQCHGVIK